MSSLLVKKIQNKAAFLRDSSIKSQRIKVKHYYNPRIYAPEPMRGRDFFSRASACANIFAKFPKI
jgi:hypothetical protein